MTIIALIRAALEALTAFLEHATASIKDRRIIDSEARQQQLISEIERLREIGSSGATQNADLLSQTLQREKQKYEKFINE